MSPDAEVNGEGKTKKPHRLNALRLRLGQDQAWIMFLTLSMAFFSS